MINLNSPTQTHKLMSAALYINNSTTRVRKDTLSHKVEVGANALLFVIIALVTFISLAYLANANQNATKGYSLKNLELKRTQLLTENEVWDMEIARVQSLASIQNDPKIKSMVKTDTPMFIRGDTAIASK
ncbi:hypothetical protein KAR91_60885 [Candidatus Pacearchaeota archaeon]|nr:hypothetical protein [Candidatus Pacearchaeota archaeon]